MLQTKGEKSRKLRNAQVVDPTSVVLFVYIYERIRITYILHSTQKSRRKSLNRIPKKAISCNFLSSSQKEGKKHRKKGEGELRKLNEIENYFTDG